MPPLIPRPRYTDQLARWRNKDLIKVVTGVRRCGKSTVLDMYADALLATGVAPQRIVKVNLEDMANQELRDYQTLHAHVVNRLSTQAMTYVLVDEIQLAPKFEETLNSLRLRQNVDIYVTGSNAHLMSSELGTLLTGRYVEIPMQPLSFGEYCRATGVPPRPADLAGAYRQYVVTGGFPYLLAIVDDPQAQTDYLRSLYDSILLRDVIARYRVAEPALLDDVARYLFSAIGSLSTPNRLANTLTSAGRSVNARTVEKYLTGLIDCLMFYPARRYDIKGKRILERSEKYYAVDPGLRRAVLGESGGDVGHVLENIVFLELLARKYQVNVGKAGDAEIDFLARTPNDQVYVQVAATVRDPATLARELRPLQMLRDSYPKLLLTLDDDPPASHNGIRVVNALEWLADS